MADIKLSPEEEALYGEVGSRGDYFRAAIADRAAEELDRTGRPTEITSQVGRTIDVVLPPDKDRDPGDASVTDVVPPGDLESVVGPAPGSDPPKKP